MCKPARFRSRLLTGMSGPIAAVSISGVAQINRSDFQPYRNVSGCTSRAEKPDIFKTELAQPLFRVDRGIGLVPQRHTVAALKGHRKSKAMSVG